MATAATVSIRLDADSATLVAELQKAERATKSSFSAMQKDALAFAGAATKAAAVAMAAVAAGAAALAAESFRAVDALAKTSDRLGIATEALKTFQVAADLAGVSQERLEKALLKQQKAISDAANGSAQLRQTFQALGLNAQTLMALPIDKQFEEIANALNDVDNVTRRNALAMEIWGARGIEMVNVAQAGVGSIGELRQLLEDLNVTVSRFDAAKIEQANDAVSMVKTAFQGLGNTIAIAVAPVLQGLSDQFVEAARSSNGFESEVQLVMDTVAAWVGFAADAVFVLKNALQQLLGVTVSIGGQMITAFAGLAGVITDYLIGPTLAGIAAIANGAKVIAGALGNEGLAMAAYEVEAGLDSVNDALSAGVERAREFGNTVAGYGKGLMDSASEALNGELPSAAIERWLADVQAKSAAAAAETAAKMRKAIDAGSGGGGLDQFEFDPTTAIKRGSDRIADPKLSKIEVPLGDANAIATREYTEIATQQYLEAWQLANEQRVIADQALKDTLFQGDQEAGEALIQLAAEQAREKVLAEFEARGVAMDETGQIADPEKRVEFERAVQDATLAREAEFLDRRLNLQRQFGNNYLNIQRLVQGVFGKSWADTHASTLKNVATFASATQNIATSLFGQNKKVGIANALISTFVGVAKALELPFPANLAAAATTLAAGMAQVRSIQSTSTSGGGGIGSISTGGALSSAATPASPPASFGERAAQGDRAVQVIFQGDVNGWDQYIEQRVISSIRDAVSERDVIIVDPRSRNARDLVGG
jgi:hypothetical protein